MGKDNFNTNLAMFGDGVVNGIGKFPKRQGEGFIATAELLGFMGLDRQRQRIESYSSLTSDAIKIAPKLPSAIGDVLDIYDQLDLSNQQRFQNQLALAGGKLAGNFMASYAAKTAIRRFAPNPVLATLGTALIALNSVNFTGTTAIDLKKKLNEITGGKIDEYLDSID